MQPETEAPVAEKAKTAKKPPADALPVYDVPVNIAKISTHIVPKEAVTAAEIALLIAQFGLGPEGVGLDKAEEAAAPVLRVPDGVNTETKVARFKRERVYYLPKHEIPRLREKYGQKLVKHVFGAGLSVAIPKTLDDLKEMVIEPFVKEDEKEAA